MNTTYSVADREMTGKLRPGQVIQAYGRHVKKGLWVVLTAKRSTNYTFAVIQMLGSGEFTPTAQSQLAVEHVAWNHRLKPGRWELTHGSTSVVISTTTKETVAK